MSPENAIELTPLVLEMTRRGAVAVTLTTENEYSSFGTALPAVLNGIQLTSLEDIQASAESSDACCKRGAAGEYALDSLVLPSGIRSY
jgi:hypothetical protein